MSVETPEELAGLRRVGRLVASTLRALRREVRPGVTTAELDAVAAALFATEGATSAPRTTYGFPGTICISVNDEIVHGVPGPRVLRAGDLVTLDVTPELDGYVVDAAVTVPVGPPTPQATRLLRAAHACLRDAVSAAVTGGPLRAIGAATERTAWRRGVPPRRDPVRGLDRSRLRPPHPRGAQRPERRCPRPHAALQRGPRAGH